MDNIKRLEEVSLSMKDNMAGDHLHFCHSSLKKTAQDDCDMIMIIIIKIMIMMKFLINASDRPCKKCFKIGLLACTTV